MAGSLACKLIGEFRGSARGIRQELSRGNSMANPLPAFWLGNTSVGFPFHLQAVGERLSHAFSRLGSPGLGKHLSL